MTPSTYDPRRDEHPVAPALRGLGELTLVGSRAFDPWLKFATAESDWDYYLVLKTPGGYNPLKDLGFVPLAGGGPYGADGEIAGIWRLPEHTAYGRTWAAVDLIVCSADVAARRLPVLERITRMGRRGGELCRGIKSEAAWGAFWFATRGAP